MRTSITHPVRLLTGITLATVLNLSLGACSPVVLQEDTDTDATGGSSGGPDTDGASSNASDSTAGEGGGEGGETVPEACIDLQPRVLGILETNCAKCHGSDGANLGGIDYILDIGALISQDKVIPGDAEGSRIFARMSAGTMPPPTEMQRPSPTDTEIVEKWINECAGVQSCAEQPFLGREHLLQTINQDLSTINLETLPFTRYFSFVHLYNAGWCDAEIDVFREALSKLVNSLSHGTLIKAPVAIDKERLIYRIDIGDYKWEAVVGKEFRLSEPTVYFRDADNKSVSESEQLELDKRFSDIWEMMADQNPYAIEYIGDLAVNIKKQTGTNFPILPGDAFIDATSRSPLYYDILGIPKRSGKLKAEDADCLGADDCLESQLGINILQDIQDEFDKNKDFTGRAGFKKSDVSLFNRVVERHLFNAANNRAFWISYDFNGQNGDQNILVNPLDFNFNGGEVIFSLENGLQGYMLTDAAGGRLNEGPTEIVQDKSQKDQLVRNGVSCMGCHNAGLIKVNDDIRSGLDAMTNGTDFDDITKDKIRDLYPRQDEFEILQDEDVDRFNAGLTKAGVTVGAKDPVLTSFLSFDLDVTLRRVGAEYDLSESDILKRIGELGDDLSALAEGASIQRADFSEIYRTGVCILKIGCTRSCPGQNDDVNGRICGVTDIDGDGSVDPL